MCFLLNLCFGLEFHKIEMFIYQGWGKYIRNVLKYKYKYMKNVQVQVLKISNVLKYKYKYFQKYLNTSTSTYTWYKYLSFIPLSISLFKWGKKAKWFSFYITNSDSFVLKWTLSNFKHFHPQQVTIYMAQGWKVLDKVCLNQG